MKRIRWESVLFALGFFVFFALSGVQAAATVKDTTVTVSMELPQVIFSLSSGSALLIPLAVFAMGAAVVAFLCKQDHVGMMFSLVGSLCFGLFLLLFPLEEKNATLYPLISGALKDAGVTFKKRDVKAILAAFDLLAFLSLGCGILSAVFAFPTVKTADQRRACRRHLLPYAYIGPHLFFFIIFFVTPAIYGVYAAFTKWDLFNEPAFVGLENFRTLLLDSSNTYYRQLRNGLWNTIRFVLYSVPFSIILPLALAVALKQKCKGSKFFQALYYLPSLLSITTVTLSWRYVFNYDYGVMNHFLGSTVNWFTPPYTWIMLVVVTVWWCAGGNMVIYQSALASIPQDQYEAAACDGANSWQRFLHVTLPGMRYPLTYTFVMSVVAQFNIYGQPLILTGFANQEANAVLLMYVYENAVKKQVAGMSAAMALILGICIMLVSFLQMRLMRRNTPN